MFPAKSKEIIQILCLRFCGMYVYKYMQRDRDRQMDFLFSFCVKHYLFAKWCCTVCGSCGIEWILGLRSYLPQTWLVSHVSMCTLQSLSIRAIVSVVLLMPFGERKLSCHNLGSLDLWVTSVNVGLPWRPFDKQSIEEYFSCCVRGQTTLESGAGSFPLGCLLLRAVRALIGTGQL